MEQRIIGKATKRAAQEEEDQSSPNLAKLIALITINKMDWNLASIISLGSLVDSLAEVAEIKNPEDAKEKKEFGNGAKAGMTNDEKLKYMLERVKAAKEAKHG